MAGQTITGRRCKLLTAQCLLFVLSVSTLSDSVADLMGWNATLSVITQEASTIIGGHTETVHCGENRK